MEQDWDTAARKLLASGSGRVLICLTVFMIGLVVILVVTLGGVMVLALLTLFVVWMLGVVLWAALRGLVGGVCSIPGRAWRALFNGRNDGG